MLWIDGHVEVLWAGGHDEVLWAGGHDEVLCYLLIDATILTRVPWRRPQSVKPTKSRCGCVVVCLCVLSD